MYVKRVIAYWSWSCKPAERNYSATECEALAAKEGLVHFLPFIEGEKTAPITDHTALQWARTFENTNCLPCFMGSSLLSIGTQPGHCTLGRLSPLQHRPTIKNPLHPTPA